MLPMVLPAGLCHPIGFHSPVCLQPSFVWSRSAGISLHLLFTILPPPRFLRHFTIHLTPPFRARLLPFSFHSILFTTATTTAAFYLPATVSTVLCTTISALHFGAVLEYCHARFHFTAFFCVRHSSRSWTHCLHDSGPPAVL